jgi:uncharacterized protein YbjT (DUF2867 family)
MGVKLIVTGATGMVGEGVLFECLEREDIKEVLIINRKPSGMSHPKLKEIIHADFYDFSSIAAQLQGYDGCLFCLGTTSLGKDEATYTKITHTLTMHVAETLVKQNSNMVFCYISGASTDSTEKGETMWARVKGKTENDLMKLPFKAAYNFRPGMMKPTKGQKNVLSAYKYVGWLYPVIRALFPGVACTIAEVGQAMINAVTKGYEKNILEVKDIVALAKDKPTISL